MKNKFETNKQFKTEEFKMKKYFILAGIDGEVLAFNNVTGKNKKEAITVRK